MKHTKGPWTIINAGMSEYGILAKDSSDLICTTDKSKNELYNAHLIAAAPEMLEELIFVAERLHAENFDADLVENITNLIKKAKGE